MPHGRRTQRSSRRSASRSRSPTAPTVAASGSDERHQHHRSSRGNPRAGPTPADLVAHAQLTTGFDRLSIQINEANQRLGQQVHDLAAGLHTVNQKVDDFKQVMQAKFEELEARIASGPPPPEARPL